MTDSGRRIETLFVYGMRGGGRLLLTLPTVIALRKLPSLLEAEVGLEHYRSNRVPAAERAAAEAERLTELLLVGPGAYRNAVRHLVEQILRLCANGQAVLAV